MDNGLDTIGAQVLALLAVRCRRNLVPDNRTTISRRFLARIARPAAVALLSCLALRRRNLPDCIPLQLGLTLSVTKNAPVWSPYDLRLPEEGAQLRSTRDLATVSVTSLSAHCSRVRNVDYLWPEILTPAHIHGFSRRFRHGRATP
jgi:hypothetical protein